MQDKRKMAVIIVMSAIVFIITLLSQMMLGQRAQDEQNRTSAAQTQTTPAGAAPKCGMRLGEGFPLIRTCGSSMHWSASPRKTAARPLRTTSAR